jgi:hypothetical protein
MKYAKKIVLLVIAALLVLYLGYRIWFYKQYHIDMTFEGTLVLLDGTTIPMTVNVEGYIKDGKTKTYSREDRVIKVPTEISKLKFQGSENEHLNFVNFDEKEVFENYWDIPYIIESITLLDKQDEVAFGADYALSVEKGLLLIYTDWFGLEKGHCDELGYYFYGSVNGDYTLEEMQEYFAVFHRDFGN